MTDANPPCSRPKTEGGNRFGHYQPTSRVCSALSTCASTNTGTNGYATVDFGRWHYHLCIGEHRAGGPELGRIRKCTRAELYRRVGDESPTSWGVRLFNGRDEQMRTVLLPNPFLTNEQPLRDRPDWAQLELWDRLRAKYLELDPDSFDRSGKGFQHG